MRWMEIPRSPLVLFTAPSRAHGHRDPLSPHHLRSASPHRVPHRVLQCLPSITPHCPCVTHTVPGDRASQGGRGCSSPHRAQTGAGLGLNLWGMAPQVPVGTGTPIGGCWGYLGCIPPGLGRQQALRMGLSLPGGGWTGRARATAHPAPCSHPARLGAALVCREEGESRGAAPGPPNRSSSSSSVGVHHPRDPPVPGICWDSVWGLWDAERGDGCGIRIASIECIPGAPMAAGCKP